ncbi:prepilin peptidase [Clostridioides difficile]|uniref:prepilin peptidase n=2 Tax=Clostridioides difficile TaxID=1496 RepID=UPI00097FF60B|nr:prepilin peptidase [Clostridioides difficile]MCI9996609.1 prepilin peptidase [Clostridioides difficile]MCJ0056507.1 prepilin peptidase [Clostridioides difficile]MCU5873736.1 prepilin peptidase [Clostridioides difficile]MCU5899655.1 prepilin peptidase [Clostridioides difficile]
MEYIIIISLFFAHLINKSLCVFCDREKKNLYNTFFIYIITVVLSVLIYLKFGISVECVQYMVLIPFLIIISIVDYYTIYVYDITIVSGIIVQGIIFLVFFNIVQFDYINHIFGLLIGFIIPYIIAKLTKGLGYGDVGLYSLCCFALGNNYGFYVIVLSFILAFLFFIILYITKIFKDVDIIKQIPFTPFISLSTILIIFTEYNIFNFYYSLLYKFI